MIYCEKIAKTIKAVKLHARMWYYLNGGNKLRLLVNRNKKMRWYSEQYTGRFFEADNHIPLKDLVKRRYITIGKPYGRTLRADLRLVWAKKENALFVAASEKIKRAFYEARI